MIAGKIKGSDPLNFEYCGMLSACQVQNDGGIGNMKSKTVKLILGILFFFALLLFRLSLVPALAQVTATDFVVTEQRADKLSRVTPAGARTVIYSFASGTWPNTVTIDMNGDFIVAEYVGKLSRVTPAGVRTVIYSFASGTVPDQVAIDKNGDFIVAETYTNKLSRVTPAGVRTVIFNFASGTIPTGVAIDSNGDFIVTEHGTNKLVRITPGGVRTEIFSFPGGTGLHFLAIDSSGNFIVPAAFTNKLYRVTPAGAGTEVFSFPAGTYATGVAIDSNGDYIIPGLFSNKLYRITPSGVGTVIFNFAAGTGPASVAVLAPQCVEPPLGLVSWWPGEASGNDIVDGNDGTLQNGATFAPGMVGQAFSFDGVDDDVIVAHNPNLNLSEFTLDAWIKADPDVSRHRPIVAKEDDLSVTPWFNRNYWFGLNISSGQLLLIISSGGGIQIISGPALNDGQWHHVAATRAANGAAKLYVDGVLVASGSFGVPDFSTSPLHIGRWGINSAGVATRSTTDRSSFKGLIDEVELFDRALSAQEIQAIYNAGSLGICQAPADTTPPTTSATPSPGPNANGWNNTNVMVTLNATDSDGGSGVKEVHYSLNGAPETVVSGNVASVVISAEGTNSVSYYAKDNAGNTEGAKNLTIRIDKTPPSIVGLRTPGPNTNGWNNTDVTVSFTCLDSLAGIDSCGPTPQVVSIEGAGQSRTGTAVDMAGNSASTTMSGINIDRTLPMVTYSGNAGTYTVDQSVAITCAAADALSGVASDTCANINGPAYTFTLGTNSFSASATDLAGNTGNGSTSFTVQVTAAGLGNLVMQFVTKAGVANSMISKLNAAAAAEARGNAQAKAGAIGAFINELQAQAGKALTAAQAATLIALAQAL